jgi:MFS family permease
MLVTIRSLFALLLSGALLLAGGGLMTTLLALRAQLEGFPTWLVGSFFASYSVGFLVGCLYLTRTIRAVGHIRVFAALAATTGATALLYMIAINPVVWLLLRAVNGFCLAGLSMVIESWMNDRADNANRGRLLSIYRIVDMGSNTGGQLLLLTAEPHSYVLFAIVSVLISLAVVPVALTRATAPAPIAAVKLNLGNLFAVSPLSVMTCLGVGVANGAYWALGPVFAHAKGLDSNQIAYFMTAVIVGGAVVQYPIGYLSDRVDRRTVLIAITMIASLASLALAHTGTGPTLWLYSAAVLFGASAMPMYGLAIAHASDTADRDDFVRVSSGLLLSYSVGAIAGSIIGGAAMSVAGPSALFIHTAIVQALLVVFGVYRTSQRKAPPVAAQGEFVSVPRTTPEIFRLDPRGDEESEAGEGEVPSSEAPEAPHAVEATPSQ